MSSLKLARLVSLLIFSIAIATPATVDAIRALDGFDVDVERTMRELQAPGAAVGVIQDGKVILAKGYGVREIGKTTPVTADSIFALGSITKSFTAVTVAAMVDEGKLDFDKPVRDYLPWFQLYDPVATSLITSRDLLTHRSGLPGHNFIRFSTPLARAELVRRLRYLEPNRTFRDIYQYNNLMYVTAGFLAGEAAGKSWEDLVIDRIFKPLGMSNSTVSTAETQKRDNFARPHVLEGGAVKTTEFYSYQKFGVGPNGAVNSTVNDFLKYLQFHLDQGKAAGKQLISEARMKELYRPVTTNGTNSYALGWNVQHHRGHAVLQHGGAITGFTAKMMLIPEDKTGIIVMNNLGSALPDVLASVVADRLLGLDPKDYLAEVRKARDRARDVEQTMLREREARRTPGTKPTLDLSAYAGEYFHPAYGVIHVERQNPDLIVNFAAISLPLKHYHYDTFECVSALVRGMAQFRLDQTGRVAELLLPLEPAVKPLVFVKR